MPPSLAPVITTPRLPPAIRACGLAIVLSLPLLSACNEDKPAATVAASAPEPTSAASAPPPSFMRIGSVTADVGEAPAASATAAAAADEGPSAKPQSNERGGEAPPLPRGTKATGGEVPS